MAGMIFTQRGVHLSMGFEQNEFINHKEASKAIMFFLSMGLENPLWMDV